MKSYITLAEAAKRLGLSTSTLLTQVKRGRFKAERISTFYIVTEREVERYRAESLGKPGRHRR
jgi:excisionase family DNA binding protein